MLAYTSFTHVELKYGCLSVSLSVLEGVCLNSSPQFGPPTPVSSCRFICFCMFTGAVGEVHGGKRKPG